MQAALRVLEAITAALAVCAIAYNALCLWSAFAFRRLQKRTAAQKQEQQVSTPAVSILKPLKGIDPHLYDAFRSHCLQDYPEYEIIFGVNDADDPALELVRQLQKEFPNRTLRWVVCDRVLGANTKVSNLAQMLPAARHEYLIVNDSDICVPPHYLRRVIGPLNDPSLGAVTCLYQGIAGPTLGSRLESLSISTDFFAGVLTARYLEKGLTFGFGSTIAFRRRDLQSIGGFESFVNHLADDYELAGRIAGLGLGVHLSDLVLQTFLPAYGLADYVRHQLRWARGIRACRPSGYAGLIFTFGIAWSGLALLISRGASWSWGLLVAMLVARIMTAIVVGKKVLRDSQVLRLLWLLPLRDIFAFFIWIGSFAGRTVTWRGNRFYLKDGKLVRIGVEISQ